jgi:hypothetical protein
METVKTVLAGAIGIRRRTAHDAAAVKPLHVVAAAIIFVVLFVLTLRLIVGYVVS